MSFTIDKQTLDDLNLTGRYKPDSIFNLFNKVQSSGAVHLLEHFFQNPLSDPEKIEQRTRIFGYFQEKALHFPFQNEDIVLMENYLGNSIPGNVLALSFGHLKKRVSAAIIHNEAYANLQAGFNATIRILNTLEAFLSDLAADTATHPYLGLTFAISFFLDHKLKWLKTENMTMNTTPALVKLIRYDHLLRHSLQNELRQVLQLIYELDVYIAVSAVAKANTFCYAKPHPKEKNCFTATNLRHPALKNAVGNPLNFQQSGNVLFLTGANMAGKSTLMKSFGISLYLAHMGFPVAADALEFSIKDGIYSSINVSDNLNMGYSHFYAEVLRVKTVAEEVSAGKDMVVIFDELFKGTNVKDAYDATLAVTSAFALYRNCFFVISTHIIEVGEALQQNNDSVMFQYLPTVMKGTVPTYTYMLEQGITTDRQGMVIIENEGILNILKL